MRCHLSSKGQAMDGLTLRFGYKDTGVRILRLAYWRPAPPSPFFFSVLPSSLPLPSFKTTLMFQYV